MEAGFSWVAEELAVGGSFASEAAPRLAALGIRYVIDLRDEARDDAQALARAGLSLLWLPTPDNRAIAPPSLREGVRWIGARLASGGRALIHCRHGVGRSALLGCCVLVSRGLAPLDALAQLKRARPAAAPNEEQLRAFAAWSAAWRREHGLLWTPPDVDALIAVAWRPAPE